MFSGNCGRGFRTDSMVIIEEALCSGGKTKKEGGKEGRRRGRKEARRGATVVFRPDANYIRYGILPVFQLPALLQHSSTVHPARPPGCGFTAGGLCAKRR